MSQQDQHVYEFGPFRLDAVERILLRDGRPVPLTPKAFETLLVLVRHSGHIVEKDRLMREVWPDSFIEEGGLNVNIFRLRKALGDDNDAPRYIETVSRRGYRFVAEVRAPGGENFGPGREESGVLPAAGMEAEGANGRNEVGVAQLSNRAIPGTDRRTRAILWQRSLAIPLLALLLLTGLLGASYFWNARRQKQPESLLEVKSVAVLPFKNLGGAGGDEYLDQGMADALITKLSNLKQIVVRPTSAVLKYAGSGTDLLSAARELRVDALLEGRVQRSGERIRVTVQLVRGADGVPLWAETFDDQFTNIFAVQDSISNQVARALTLKLTGGEKALIEKRYTESAEAFELYLKGRYFWNKRTAEGFQKGIEYFEQAIAKDPSYALAYVGLADSYITLGDYSYLPPKEAFPKAREAAAKALELDDSLAEAHTSLAFTKAAYDWEWSEAEREFRRAIEIKPSYATARQWHAEHLVAMGRFDEALAEIKRAQELEPLSLIVDTIVGWVYYFMRQPDRAIEQCRKTLELDANFYPAHLFLGQAYAQKRMYREAIAEYQRALSVSEGSAEASAFLGHAYEMSGQREQARKALDELKALAQKRYVSPDLIAVIHSGLGETDEAFVWLEKAYEERSRSLPFLRVDPMFDNLRADPRFTDLLRRVGL
jgi:TolB-like protein/DNA-binding winged helix-turn-helix (wHTH) protein/Tfp pilus assembly protein PilF